MRAVPHDATISRRLAGAIAAGALAVTIALGVAPARGPSRAVEAPIRLVPAVRVDARLASRTPPTIDSCKATSGGVDACYDPAELQAAYDLGPLYAAGVEGQGETIVIVDCYGSPTITADLGTFDAAFGLPAPPSFRIITPRGRIPAYSPTGKDRAGWAQETSLDVEWAHALAPKASILLVETPTDEVEGTTGFPDIVAAEHVVIKHHMGTVISQSFGATEQTFASKTQLLALRSAFVAAKKAGITVLGGSGDLGATDFEKNAKTIYPYRVTSWPASDPYVTAVGGTKLDLSSSGTQLTPAVAWNDTYATRVPYPSASGGGLSIFFPRPSYQAPEASIVGTHRGVPDVAMSAACTGLVDVYVAPSGGPNGWHPTCGTSEATPLFAAIVALADQEAGHGLGLINPALYALAGKSGSGLVPVTSGDNTVAFNGPSGTVTVSGFAARAGYSLVTGLGTIDAAAFVPALVRESRALGH